MKGRKNYFANVKDYINSPFAKALLARFQLVFRCTEIYTFLNFGYKLQIETFYTDSACFIACTLIFKARLQLQFLLRFPVRFSSSDGCERVDEL
jgi:hypothetical protein